MKLHRETLLAGIILALVIGVGLRAPAFVTLPSLLGVLSDTSPLFMLTLAQMGVLLTRGIDLSVAANLALTGMVAGLVNHNAPGLPIAGHHCARHRVRRRPRTCQRDVDRRARHSSDRRDARHAGGLSRGDLRDRPRRLAHFQGYEFRIHRRAESPSFWEFRACLDRRSGGDRRLDFPQSHGRRPYALYAVGGNPVAARYCGIDLARQQLIVYMVSGAVSGSAVIFGCRVMASLIPTSLSVTS